MYINDSFHAVKSLSIPIGGAGAASFSLISLIFYSRFFTYHKWGSCFLRGLYKYFMVIKYVQFCCHRTRNLSGTVTFCDEMESWVNELSFTLSWDEFFFFGLTHKKANFRISL